ncbi:MAG: sigma-70 family RNA polymerase sigma factor [Oscillatoria sp. SIO1A7]|nr:sigma-70 family RNA polymerase sigma factor [Oscillatoria sp. SIO1A7]
MDNLDKNLRQLIAEACSYPAKSPQRQQRLSEVYRLVTKSRKLWRESVPYYNDALQEMWEFCCQNPELYDPSKCRVTTWLDDELKKRLRRWRDGTRRQQQRQMYARKSEEGQAFDLVGHLPARPDVEPALEIMNATLNWIATDPEGTLRKTLFRKRADINCQALIRRRFPSETPWKEIAAEFNLTPSEATDLPKFYNRKCLPLLRSFGVAQGYIEDRKTPKRRKAQ